tara:strand:- start:427 stop:600 length:174 start_codon:yes stop_codon:yes gene_type:complete
MIDNTKWTDAQLESYPFYVEAIAKEIERRKKLKTWKTDGSTERVAKLIKNNNQTKTT